MMRVKALDHLVLTVRNLESSIQFYETILGMQATKFQPANSSMIPRWALTFGQQKINLHPAEAPFAPYATHPKPGSADMCFLSDAPLTSWQEHFMKHNVKILEGPVKRTGATGPIESLYVLDPDGNLIEVSNCINKETL